jgi:DNA-directed RNA polymerase subunit alpha
MEPTVKFQLGLTIGKGRGYVPAEENKPEEAPFGLIPIDAIFTPIKNVKYSVENWRVEQKTDYEKLTIEITTDGSIHPKNALHEAAKILIYHFMLFSEEKITFDAPAEVVHDEFDEETLRMRQLLKTKLIDLELSVRALNCLKTAEVENLGDLVRFQRNDLLKFRNFGRKSLNEIDALVDRSKLHFGMDVVKYKLDKD